MSGLICSSCGRQNEAGAVFCSNCGAQLGNSQASVDGASPYGNNFNQSAPNYGPEPNYTQNPGYTPNPSYTPNQGYAPNAGAPYQNMNMGAQPRTSGVGIAAMVLGIVGIVFSILFFPVGMICAVLGLILGIVARSQITNSHGTIGGSGLAVAGIALGAVALIISIFMMAACISAVNTYNNALDNLNNLLNSY